MVPPEPDIDALVRSLRVTNPPARPPAIPWHLRRPRRWHGGLGMAAAAVAMLAVGIAQMVDNTRVTARGPSAVDPPLDGELRMLVSRGGRATRVGDGSTVHLDEVVYFRLCAPSDQDLALSVDGPFGRQLLAETTATSDCVDARANGQILGYAFDRSGSHRFILSGAKATELDAITLHVR